MKNRAVGLAVMLILTATFAAARPAPSSTRFSNLLLNDVVQMTKAGIPEPTILAFVRARHALLDSVVSADDLIELRRSGVGDSVLRYIASVAAVDVGATGEGRSGEVTYDSGESTAYPVEPAHGGVYAYPYPYGYPAYGPYFSGSVFVGRPFFRGRFFFHRPFFRRRVFFHRPFFRHRAFFHNRVIHRPFFRGRRF